MPNLVSKLRAWLQRPRPTESAAENAAERADPITPPADLQRAAEADYSAIHLYFLPPQEAYPVDLEEGEFLFIGEVADGGAVVCSADGTIYFFDNWRTQLAVGCSCAEAARAITRILNNGKRY